MSSQDQGLENLSVRFVEPNSWLDFENYRRLIDATRVITEIVMDIYEKTLNEYGTAYDWTTATTYLRPLREYLDKIIAKKYYAGYGDPVYTWHYTDLMSIAKLLFLCMWHRFRILENAGIPVPDEVKEKLDDIYNEVMAFPKIKSGQPVASEHHNEVVRVLRKILDLCGYEAFLSVIKQFNIYVKNTRVRKYWDHLILPDGTRVDIPEGKYFKIYSLWPIEFGIEELTEEIGEEPDWDFDEPKVRILFLTSIKDPHGKLLLGWKASYRSILYFGDRLVYEIHWWSGGALTHF